MKTPRIVQGGVRGAAAALAFVTMGLTVAFYLTAWLYDRIGWRPFPLAVQLVNSVLGMCLTVLLGVIHALLFRSGRKGPFAPIIDALERIAKGDFSTRLDDRYQKHGAVSELVQTVNNMALQLDQMEKMRQEFISNVSHEIQSPLTSIRGFACALRQDDLGDGDRR